MVQSEAAIVAGYKPSMASPAGFDPIEQESFIQSGLNMH